MKKENLAYILAFLLILLIGALMVIPSISSLEYEHFMFCDSYNHSDFVECLAMWSAIDMLYEENFECNITTNETEIKAQIQDELEIEYYNTSEVDNIINILNNTILEVDDTNNTFLLQLRTDLTDIQEEMEDLNFPSTNNNSSDFLDIDPIYLILGLILLGGSFWMWTNKQKSLQNMPSTSRGKAPMDFHGKTKIPTYEELEKDSIKEDIETLKAEKKKLKKDKGE